MRNYSVIHIFIGFVLIPVALGVDFDICLADIRSEKFGTTGGRDNYGHPVDITNATAITYDLCVSACGAGSVDFQWSDFSQQFGTWLLPWLALVSQLPFGSNDKLDNLVAMLLTVGSPTLAAYSLGLTVLNGRWIARIFKPFTYPNTRNAVRSLSSLQQSPLIIATSSSLLTSLVILPENDEWWNELILWLDYTHTWSISAVASIFWVIIAYIFTIIDSFTGDITVSVNSNGQAVGSVWLWLLPIVIAWLQISPKCDSVRLHQAMKYANSKAYVATPSGEPILTSSMSSQRAMSLFVDTSDNPVRRDELCTAPVYNYARFLPWVKAVEEVADIFRAASDRARAHQSVNPEVEWKKHYRDTGPMTENRIGTLSQIENYCMPQQELPYPSRNRWGRDVWPRFIIASMLALSLQWGTTGAAIVVTWFTPTRGLGCRSASYLIYAVLSTVVWLMLAASSFLGHYSTTSPRTSTSGRFFAQVSIILRRMGKVVASFNALWIIVTCLFQFSNFFNRCYCNSSVFWWGSAAYDVIIIAHDDVASMKGAWIGGVVLAGGSALAFVVFVNLLINPQFAPE